METFQRTVHRRPTESPLYDEPRLVERAREGDLDAFERLFRAHYAGVYATAFHLVGNHEDAEDLAQDCFVRAQRSLEWFRGQASLRSWLRRILVHLVRDRFRAAGRRPSRSPLPELEARSQDGPSAEMGRREFGRAIDAALRSLPDHLRIPLVLRTLEGLDYDDIAEATGVTPATARTQVMKARREMHRRLARHLGGDQR